MSSISSRSGFCEADVDDRARRASPARGRSRSPPRTCPSTISFLNLRLPMTLVRSPTITGRRVVGRSTRSMPETRVRGAASAARAAACPRASSASARMCSGVVPQQPPTMLSQPSSHEALELRGEHLRRLVVAAVLVGQAGVRDAGDREARQRRERAQVIGHELGTGRAVEADRRAGRGARARRRTPRRPARRASCPSARSVPETTIGTAVPELAPNARSMPRSAALTLRVSWQVSSRRKSTPPSMRPARLRRDSAPRARRR